MFSVILFAIGFFLIGYGAYEVLWSIVNHDTGIYMFEGFAFIFVGGLVLNGAWLSFQKHKKPFFTKSKKTSIGKCKSCGQDLYDDNAFFFNNHWYCLNCQKSVIEKALADINHRSELLQNFHEALKNKERILTEWENHLTETQNQFDYRKQKEENDKRQAHKDHIRRKFDILLESIPRIDIKPDYNTAEQHFDISDLSFIRYGQLRKNSRLTPLSDFVVIDVETTGLQPESSKIIQVSAIRFRNFYPTELFTTYINPQMPIPQSATDINGITDDMVSDAPTFTNIVQSLDDFIGDSSIVAHNLTFDVKFLRYFGYDSTKTDRYYYDTLSLSRKLDTYASVHKLDAACAYHNIYFNNAHSSEHDALAAGLLFLDYIRQNVDSNAVIYDLEKA